MGVIYDGQFDASMQMGDLFHHTDKPEWPMYSYSRPAYMVWNAIGQVMLDKGYTEEQIKEWLQSKAPRHRLDGDLGDLLKATVTEWAKENIPPANMK